MRPFRTVPALIPAVIAGMALVACDGGNLDSAAHDVATVREVVSHAPRDLTEASSAAMSRSQPGVLYTINDSGNEPLLYALDTTGAARGTWRITGSTNVDWESTAVAPCVPGSSPQCVYIGDTGDNMFDRASYTIYRVREPIAGDSLLRDSLRAERLDFTYGGAHRNVEAMYVAPNGDIYLIAKLLPKFVPWMGSDAGIFRLRAADWATRDTVIAVFTGQSLHMTMITDAALSPDTRHLAVRTPKAAMIFTTTAGGTIDPTIAPATCRLTPMHQKQGEGLSWLNDAGRFVFTSEGQRAPLHIGDCPLPAR